MQGKPSSCWENHHYRKVMAISTGVHKSLFIVMALLTFLGLIQVYSIFFRGTYVISTLGATHLGEGERALLVSYAASGKAADKLADRRDGLLHLRRQAILEKWGFEDLVISGAGNTDPKVSVPKDTFTPYIYALTTDDVRPSLSSPAPPRAAGPS